MADESDLNTYKLQLQQVEAALTTEPDNEELIQLKQDLSQVIELTSQLINPAGSSEPVPEKQPYQAVEEENELEHVFTKTKSEEKKKSSRWAAKEAVLPVKPWQVGEKCQAPYNGNLEKYYNGKILEINGDKVSITFDGYTSIESASLGDLKLPKDGATTPFTKNTKRELEIKRKEYLKEKKIKKREKLENQIQTKEKEKKQWQSFANKAFGKRGFVKKSIFKTPESSDGKVGVGTCGVSGQGMTDYNPIKKHRKTNF